MRLIDDGSAVLARSPAKLNLLLAIRGRRPDGFHEIETLMVKIAVWDSVRFAARPDGEIVLHVRRTDRETASVPAGPGNLVVRAAESLRHHAGIRYGADIVLEKRIPAEAGLAGGSGNAAAALAGLNRLWRLGFDRSTLEALAAELGSDVPFFLSGASAAVARGRGERIEPVSLGVPLHFVVVKPAFGLSTVDVYRTFAERVALVACPPVPASDATAESLVRTLTTGHLADAARFLHNDLMPAAEQLRPELALVRKRLQEECRYGGLMTGSGSACFGLCGTAREAATAAARLRAIGVGQVFATMSA